VLLVGGDTVVSRTLQMYLRQEGYDTTLVPEDLGGRVGAGLPRAAQLVIIASAAGAAQRAQLCRKLREHSATCAAPILELLGTGEGQDSPAANGAGSGAGGATGGGDAIVVWPFRLREILGKVEELIGAPGVPFAS
jgi:DNA-binding response OmpR family regulator